MNFDDYPEVETPRGAHERYEARQTTFDEDGDPYPRLRHTALWVLHNVVAHPILAVIPNAKAVEFHELTSRWLNHDERTYFSVVLGRRLPKKIPSRRAWVLHNFVAHVGIGLFPCKATFDYHDKTAEAMKVPGWV